jgi:hypothetical protein
MRLRSLVVALFLILAGCATINVQVHPKEGRTIGELSTIIGNLKSTPATCLSETAVLLNTSWNCPNSAPNIDRAFSASRFTWNSREYLVINTGNELEFWRIDQAPLIPPRVQATYFDIDPPGDVDYGLDNYSLGVEWGCAGFRTGTMVFRFVSDAWGHPHATDEHWYSAARSRGCAMYQHAGAEYMVSQNLPDSCTGPGVYRLGPWPPTLVSCVPWSTGAVVRGGKQVGDAVYLGDSYGKLWVFRIDGWTLEALGQLASGVYWIKQAPLSVDGETMAIASSAGLGLWDVSSPTIPILISQTPGSIHRVSIRDGLAITAQKSVSPWRLWDVSDLSNPREIEQIETQWNCPPNGRKQLPEAVMITDEAVYFAEFAIARSMRIDACVEVPIFTDGFESHTLDMWSMVVL